MSNKSILIVGGAGYIGSHANKLLSEQGYNTIVYDNLVYGYEGAVKWGRFIKGDISDKALLLKVLKENKIDAVMHFSAFAYVGESVTDPKKYYQNNVANTLVLLDAMLESNVKQFIFSSTCATFGTPKYVPIDEKHVQNPINPYGQTKLMVEKILKDYDTAYGLKYVSLRYFNAAGADPSGVIGEKHNPETHLIPLVLDVAMGKRDDIKIFGSDYPTSDGTAIRDYIHVNDLSTAHILALDWLIKGESSQFFNLGNGRGYSVKEVIDTARKITGNEIKVVLVDRRAGDPPELIGESKKAFDLLGWNPKFADLNSILETAWKWHQHQTF